MAIKIKNFISFILIALVAVVTGVSVGRIYVQGLEVPTIFEGSEEEIRETEETVLALVEKSKSQKVTSFSGVELWVIAEYNLLHHEEFYKLMTGVVNAPMGIKQQMRSQKLKKDGKLVYNKLSPSTSSLSPSICSRIIYDYNTQDVVVYPTGTFGTGSEITGVFDDNNKQNWTMDQYKQTFNGNPENVLSYIISSKTCPASCVLPVSDNHDGTYSFQIKIEGSNLVLAGMNYAYEIKFSSGMADPPKWVSLQMDVTVDSSFNFKKIEYEESYKMNVPVVGLMQVTDNFVDNFYFSDIPTLDEILGEVA